MSEEIVYTNMGHSWEQAPSGHRCRFCGIRPYSPDAKWQCHGKREEEE